ncbi:MAG: glycosyltransferase [Acetobacteraceae bacterium]|nr:glycosyltransferase [Acetobacteraceae bacterium]
MGPGTRELTTRVRVKPSRSSAIQAEHGLARPLRILSVAYPFAPVTADSAGGAEQILFLLDRALVRAGHNSTVIGCDGSRVFGKLIALPPVPAVIDEKARHVAHQTARHAISQVLQSGHIDLIHMHGIDFFDYLPPPGRPVLATLHLPPAWYPKAIFHLTRPATYLHCVSANQHHACPGSDRLLPPITNGVPVEELASVRHARRSFCLVLGRVCPEKGQHLALRAAHAAGIPLLIAGSVFPYEAHRLYFDEQVRPLLDRARRWIGPIGFARKRRLIAAARCVLIPSLAPETSSLVAMEAASCGTPVIAFRAGALCDTVEHETTGFLVENAFEMSQAIPRTALIDPERCRATARARFCMNSMIEAYFNRYELLAQSASGAR